MKLKELSKELSELGKQIRKDKNELVALEQKHDRAGWTKDTVARRRVLERAIRQNSRKAMHMNIAVSIMYGTPLSKTVAPNTRKKIRPESVFAFLWEID